MTKAPERIWAKDKYDTWGSLGDWYADGKGGGTPYTRTDLCAAALARAEKAEAECRKLALEILQNHTEIFGLSEERNALRAQVAQLTEWDAAGRIERLVNENDALRAALEIATQGLIESRDELDAYSRQEYNCDHPVHERYRQRDYDANPARIALEALKGTPND